MTQPQPAACGNCEDIDPATCLACHGMQPAAEPLNLAPIQARCDAATPGRWLWHGTARNHDFRLQTAGWDVVLDFVRHGLQGAQPRFNTNGLMEKASDILPAGQNAAHGFPHPDAEFIAHARQDVPNLIAEVLRLRAKLAEERAVNKHLTEKHTATLTAADEWMGERAQLLAEQDRLRDVLQQTQQLAELDSVTCESCGHLESAHDPNGDRSCNASGARVRACSCSYFIACYPEPTNTAATAR